MDSTACFAQSRSVSRGSVAISALPVEIAEEVPHGLNPLVEGRGFDRPLGQEPLLL